MSMALTYRKGKAFLEYALQRTRLSSPPLYFVVDITNACNLKCVTCPQAFPKPGLKRGMMKPETFDLLMTQIGEMRPVVSVNLYLSGEPLLHPRFPELVRLTNRRLGMRPWVSSNGTLWSEEMIRCFVDDGLGGVQVDFSADRATFAAARDNADWDLVHDNIKRLLAYRTRRGRRHPTVTLKDVVTTKHLTPAEQAASLQRLQALFAGYPVDRYVPYRLHNWSAAFAERVAGDPDYISRPEQMDGYHPCSHLWFSMSIAWDGRVVACCRDSEYDGVVGNIHERALRDIWNDAPLRRMRELMVGRQHTAIPLCAQCDRVYTGGYAGGTPGRMLLERLKMRRDFLVSRFFSPNGATLTTPATEIIE